MLLQLVAKRYPLKPVRTLKGERSGGGGGGGGEEEEKEKEENTYVSCEHTHAHKLFTVSGIFISLDDDVGFSILDCRAVILGTNNPLAKGHHYIYICVGVGVGGGCFCFVLFVRLVGWFLLLLLLLLLLFCFCFVLPKIVFTVFAIRFSWPNKQHNM